MTEEQCRQCNTRETCLEIKDFDGTGCPNFRPDDGPKNDENEVSESDFDDVSSHGASEVKRRGDKETREYLKQNTRIHGWLRFFEVITIIGAVLSLGYTLFTFNFDDYGRSVFLALFDLLTLPLLLVVAILAVVAFERRNADAVFLAKLYIVAVFALNLFSLIIGDFEGDAEGLKWIVRSLIWGVVWFCYLTFSKQVKRVIPKEYRKVWKQDGLLFALLIVIPFVTYFQGMHELKCKYSIEYDGSFDFDDDERVVGTVIFQVPEGFDCEQFGDNPNNNFILMNYDNHIIVEIGEYYPLGLTKEEELDTIFNTWIAGEDVDGDFGEIMSEGDTVVNGHPCVYKVKRWKEEDYDGNYSYVRMYLIYNENSTETCLINCVDRGDDSYLNDLLPTIQFK